MTPFIITKHVCGEWSMRQGSIVNHGLCWDEMLGTTARLLLGVRLGRHAERCDEPAPDVDWELRVQESLASTGHWPIGYTIIRDDRFNGRLTFDETLGFIAIYTHSNGQASLFGGLRTYEECVQRWRSMRVNSIAGLLTYQGGAA